MSLIAIVFLASTESKSVRIVFTVKPLQVTVTEYMVFIYFTAHCVNLIHYSSAELLIATFDSIFWEGMIFDKSLL